MTHRSPFPKPYEITQALVQQVSDAVGNLSGWDFSRVNIVSAPRPWDYAEVVRRYVKPNDCVLDVGTGGGELFLALADAFAEGVAVDHSPRQIKTALANKAKQGNTNVAFQVMDASQLDFPAESFDLVLTSHLHIFPEQIKKVLRSGGYFITEMVGKRTHSNLLEAFSFTSDDFGPNWWQSRAEMVSQFTTLGCHIVAQGEMDVPFWFTDFQSLIFYLKGVPWPDDDNFDIVQQWQSVRRIVERYHSARGVLSNDHYELLIVQKQSESLLALKALRAP